MVGPTARGTHELLVSIRFILVGVLAGLLAVSPTQRPLLTEGRISSASPDKPIHAWNKKMALTNIMVAGRTNGQGVGEWFGNLL
jgi:hypothetical protein